VIRFNRAITLPSNVDLTFHYVLCIGVAFGASRAFSQSEVGAMAMALVCLLLALAPALSRRRLPAPIPSLHKYLNSRGDAATPFRFAVVSFERPLAEGSFREFWMRWNPALNYFLLYFVYRRLRLFLPRQAALLMTFVISGLLLHDLFSGDLFSSPMSLPDRYCLGRLGCL
jgi:hypothetical protein